MPRFVLPVTLKKRRNVLLAYFIVVLALAFTAPVQSFTLVHDVGETPGEHDWFEHQQGHFVAWDEQHNDDFTFRSVITVGEEFDSLGDALYLAEIASDAYGTADVLSIAWSSDTSGWVPMWSLRLESATGVTLLAPEGEEPVTSLQLASGSPKVGHQYETLVSYQAQANVIDLAIVDNTDEKYVYRGRFKMNDHAGSLSVRSGYAAFNNAFDTNIASLDAFGGETVYVPVGARWDMFNQAADGSISSVPAQHFDVNEHIVIELLTPHEVAEGEYHVRLQNGTTIHDIGVLANVEQHRRISLPVADWPLGTGILHVEYVAEGEPLLTERRSVRIGQARFRVRDVEIAREDGEIRGVVEVQTTTALDELAVQFSGTLYEKLWIQDDRDYRDEEREQFTLLDETVAVPAEGTRIPFVVPMPEDRGFYQLDFDVTVEPNVVVRLSGDYKLFHTYEPASPEPGEPYIMAVLPDTQNYARSYPTIYIRQLEWIAEQAAERNILLMLHLGDITNDNNAIQWERSVEAITLLDDVMPYVLSIGNHDMTEHGGGNAWDRDHSLINDYFFLEDQPWILGTFPEGSLENNYATFELQGEKYLVVSLEYGARDEALEWANEVVAQYPDHTGILITHAYTTRSGRRSDSARTSYDIAHNPDTTVNTGDEMWEKFVSHHANMKYVFSGHHNSENGISRQVAYGLHGNAVYEMMINYQFDTRGGDGHFALVEFRPDNTVEVKAYSPYLDIYRDDISIFGFDNHFIIDHAMNRYVSPPRNEQ